LEQSLTRDITVSHFLRQPSEERAKYKLHSSKASVSIWDEDGRTFITATVLRDPIERIISIFRYIMALKKPVELCTVKNFKLRHGINETKNNHTLSNQMFGAWYPRYRGQLPDISNFEVRLLVTRRESPRMVNASTVKQYLDQKRCRIISPLPAVTETEYNFALTRLRQMSLVGLMERMDATFKLWTHALKFDILMVPHICGNKGELHCGASDGAIAELEKQDPDVLQLLR
jgi:hypothetical protein